MKRQRRLLLPTILFCLALSSQAQNWTGILASSRAIDWSASGIGAGVPGGIPQRSTICSTLNPGATVAQINSAIANCPDGQVVFLNAGTYNLTAEIDINAKNNGTVGQVTLRGAGPDSTFLVWGSGGNFGCSGLGGDICIKNVDTNYSGGVSNLVNWTAGYSAGTTSITLNNASQGSFSNLRVGSLLI